MGYSMRPGGGKQKGNAFEREVCVKLSLWLTDGKSKDCLWRSAMSGGRATVHHKRGEQIRQMGDLCAVSPEAHAFTDMFFSECKFYADLNFLGLLTGKGKLVDFWLETVKRAATHKRLPLLIAKQNRMLPMTCLCRRGVYELNLGKRSLLFAPSLNMHIVPLHEFLRSKPPWLKTV